ncbi:Eisosome component PIL1/LSP1 [Phaffia rhodozyma]|uniref:Eisosome component PIL1/LSP1 n=1 Tax=Phaffia rhodozyma TaxID=264483 RepID=A0A0F7SFT6_PHARH|nr:Eisosome component PIL1/LSP1 [Phaffia rhodozyma]
MGIFDKAKAGIAHTTMVPILGNKDLRLLQTLITEEKAVLQASIRTSSDVHRSSNALSAWGGAEGPDLEDVCSKAADMLDLVANGFEKFADRQVGIRSLWKEIRLMEETLDDTKKKRKAVGSRSEREEKKLVKMSSENKNLPMQTELMQSLRDEMRELDTEIMNTEASLSDFKRKATKDALSIKFGGLLELAEKMTIVGELGKLLLEEIPLEITPPGYGRAPYNSFDKTTRLSVEANKCVSEVHFTRAEVTLQPYTPNLAQTQASQYPSARDDVYEDHSRYEDNFELPARFSKEPPSTVTSPNGSEPTSYGIAHQQQSSQRTGVSNTPISPAAAYRDSFQESSHQPQSTFSTASPTQSSADPIVDASIGSAKQVQNTRDDGYGNEIPLGEDPNDVLAGLALGGALATPDLTGQPPRPSPGDHRLSLGLGQSVGNGNLLNTTANFPNHQGDSTADAHQFAPSPTAEHGIVHDEPTHNLPPMQDTSSVSYRRPVPTHSSTAEGQESLLAYDKASPALGQSHELGSDQEINLEPPRPAFVGGARAPTPMSEPEVFSDAREGTPDLRGDVGDVNYASRAFQQPAAPISPPQPYQQPLPKPPTIIEPSASSPTYVHPPQPTRYGTASSYVDSPISVKASPRPYSQQIDQPTDEHSLAAAAAQREVEREMDNLAFTSVAHPPSGASAAAVAARADSVSPVSRAAGNGKINAGAFFKRGGGGRSSSGFVPPEGDVSDGGLSEDVEPAGNVKPLNIRRKAPAEVDGVEPEADRDAAPPYGG